MQIKPNGKVHADGDLLCEACEQSLSKAIAHYPFFDQNGNPPCGGLVHSEIFGDLDTGTQILYKCDKCGELQ